MLSFTSDWTLGHYQLLCQAVQEAGYQVQGVADYLAMPASPVVIMRHDVDRFPENALQMAHLEQALGIRATYYVRHVPGVFQPALLSQLAALGHEVGYHYEVLAKTRGDLEEGQQLFARELAAFRVVVPVETAAAHGSPLSRWSNQLLWSRIQPGDFGLLGEPYQAIDYRHVAYYTDTGRAWNATTTNLRDHVTVNEADFPVVSTTAELIALVRQRLLPALCIQTHPERWNGTWTGQIRSALWDLAANSAKRTIRLWRGHR